MDIDLRAANRYGIGGAVVLYLTLLAIELPAVEMMDKLQRVLGDHPWGLPLDVYLVLFNALLCLPLVWFFRHITITTMYARNSKPITLRHGDVGSVLTALSYLLFLLRDEGDDRRIHRSKRIAFLGCLYLIGLVVWWIWWTDLHGI